MLCHVHSADCNFCSCIDARAANSFRILSLIVHYIDRIERRGDDNFREKLYGIYLCEARFMFRGRKDGQNVCNLMLCCRNVVVVVVTAVVPTCNP